ncbi:hypothetical protein H7E67_06845 [Clostridium gasigenes]|uniref:hypothetical protein n=1 Tax=Clostridium gasigenes TaxID=94869 RepID=UPI0016234BDA|nr:hypothetical protein [Clostridium gasigenes]MBB6623139.1 hypothetical protein [Clostridium gasigenes]
MIINNHFDKKYIELTEDKIIFYRFLGKRTLELKKIRAAYMDDNYIIIILYGKTVRQYEVANIKERDKNLLRELIETLNKDEKLVFSSGQYYQTWGWVLYAMVPISNLIDGGSKGDYMFYTCILIFAVTMIIIAKYHKIFIYDSINNSIILERNSKKVKEYFPNESKYKFEYNTSGDRYVFKANKSKAVMIPTNIIYPAYYRQKLRKLCNISNDMEAKI